MSATDPEIAQGKCPTAIRESPTCFQLRSYSDTRLLGTQDPSELDAYLTQGQSDSLSLPTTYWQILPVGDGKVRFKDLSVDRCLSIYSNSRAYLDECQPGAAADQTFYIRGVDNAPGRYRLVPAAQPTKCLAQDGNNPALQTCDANSALQQWVFSGSALIRQADSTWKSGAVDWVRPLVWRLALQECDADQSCRWTTDPTLSADQVKNAPLVISTTCAGPVEQNSATDPSATVSLGYTMTQADTNERSVESTKSLAVKASGALAPDDLVFGISYSRTDSQTQTQTWASTTTRTAVRTTPAIPATQWGWFAETTYGRQLPGTWIFGLGSATQFSAKFDTSSPFIFPSYKPGQEASQTSAIITPYVGPNPPDTNCSAPVTDTPVITAEDLGDGPVSGQAQSVGMAFKTGDKRVEVSQLGRKRRSSCPDGSPTTGPVQVGLFKAPAAAGGSAVGLGTVTVKLASAAAGQYAYTALANPVILQPNTAYYLITEETTTGPCWAAAHTVTTDDQLGITVQYPVVQTAGVLTTVTGKPNQTMDALNMMVSE